MRSDGTPELGVLLLGEALGEAEAKAGRPFIGPAGQRLGRMIERAGFTREQFKIANAVFCQPPKNAEPPTEAIEHCKPNWASEASDQRIKVIVPLGNVPLFATTGREGILSARGYVEWSSDYNAFVLPTVHPSFILRGNSNWEAAVLYDLRHAVEVAAEGWSPIDRTYALDPAPVLGWSWFTLFQQRNRQHKAAVGEWLELGADIETPDKTTAEDEVDINLGYLPGPIYRIGFAYVWEGHTFSLTIPWDANYLDLIKALLAEPSQKIFWYRHFDIPRIKAHGLTMTPDLHDGAEAWHTLHSDLPKKLEHVVPYVVPRQPRWKHLNHGDSAAYYNAIDAAVQVEAFIRIRELLRQTNMWELYRRDVFGLNPILIFMGDQGMAIDVERRKLASLQLMKLKEATQAKLNTVAQDARPQKIYTKLSKQVLARYPEGAGLIPTTQIKTESACSECGKKANVKHTHFKCGTAPGEVPLGVPMIRPIEVRGWCEHLDFKPSQQGLVRYAQFKGQRTVSRWDRVDQRRKVSMDENAVRQMALRYPEDPVWPLVIEDREIGTLLSRYVGRLTLDPPDTKAGAATSAWWDAFRAAQYRESPVPKDRYPRHERDTPRASAGVTDDDIPF